MTAAATAEDVPRFPPPPLAPIRDRAARRSRFAVPLNPVVRNNFVPPRFSCDSDASSTTTDAGGSSPPQPRGGGLRPPPPPLHLRTSHQPRAAMPTIAASPTDADGEIKGQQDGISPVLSRAPPPPHPPAPSSSGNLGPPSRTYAGDSPTSVYSPRDGDGDDDYNAIPDEHKRIPRAIPRSSPLSPTFIRGLGIIAKKGGVRRKPPPPPIVVVHPPPGAGYLAEGKSAVVEVVSVGTAASSGGGQSPAVARPPKRRTVWGLIEGWWDLGLLERMNTVRRRK